MNSVFTFVLLIIAIVMCAGVITKWIDSRNRSNASDDQIDDLTGKIDILEERIRVLERIVTEKNVDLRQEIDRL